MLLSYKFECLLKIIIMNEMDATFNEQSLLAVENFPYFLLLCLNFLFLLLVYLFLTIIFTLYIFYLLFYILCIKIILVIS